MLALPATAAIADDDAEEFGEAEDEYDDADVSEEDVHEVALVVLVEEAVATAEGAEEAKEEELDVTEHVVAGLVVVIEVEVVTQEDA